MSIIVQKFGGTSLKDAHGLNCLLSHVKKSKDEGNDVVIVVSAMGRKGAPYATDTLIEQMENINFNIDPMKKDLMMCCGEIISASLVSHFLETQGLNSVPLLGFQAGIQTDSNFNNAEIKKINTSNILNILEKGNIAVVAGFQGMDNNMNITTLGRGGSDISAIYLGGFLNADRVDIFTDVDGVHIVDPKIIPNSKYIDHISYTDMYNMACCGAKIIHYKAVSAAERFNIPVHIRKTFSDVNGTVITKCDDPKRDQILGIIPEKDEKTGNYKGKVTIFFSHTIIDIIKNKVSNLLNKGNYKIFDIIWKSNMAHFILEPHNNISFVEELYYYFFN